MPCHDLNKCLGTLNLENSWLKGENCDIMMEASMVLLGG